MPPVGVCGVVGVRGGVFIDELSDEEVKSEDVVSTGVCVPERVLLGEAPDALRLVRAVWCVPEAVRELDRPVGLAPEPVRLRAVF